MRATCGDRPCSFSPSSSSISSSFSSFCFLGFLCCSPLLALEEGLAVSGLNSELTREPILTCFLLTTGYLLKVYVLTLSAYILCGSLFLSS